MFARRSRTESLSAPVNRLVTGHFKRFNGLLSNYTGLLLFGRCCALSGCGLTKLGAYGGRVLYPFYSTVETDGRTATCRSGVIRVLGRGPGLGPIFIALAIGGNTSLGREFGRLGSSFGACRDHEHS